MTKQQLLEALAPLRDTDDIRVRPRLDDDRNAVTRDVDDEILDIHLTLHGATLVVEDA